MRAAALLAVLGAACAHPQVPGTPAGSTGLTGDVSPVHDPTVVMDGGVAHLFSTTSQPRVPPGLVHWRTSPDLLHWTLAGTVFPGLPAWAAAAVPGAKGIWAPDISRVGDELRLYYSVSTFGKNTSAIGLAVTKTLETSDPRFGWVDRGLVIRSSAADDFNAIDPDLLVDSSGRHWLSFGSFWTGLKVVELDPVTGKPAGERPTLHAIARRSAPGAIEAPEMIERRGRFFLFASVDFCCRGIDSTYSTVVGRADLPTGPFLDADGRPLLDGGGTTFLHADRDPTRRFVGPGHVTVFTAGDADHVAYHAYDRETAGRPTLRIQRIDWSADGWPVAR